MIGKDLFADVQGDVNKQINSTISNSANQYHGTTATNLDNGSAYQQAQDGQKKADSGAAIGKAVGGAMIAGGGALIATGVASTPVGTPLIAAGAMLVLQGGMELMQAKEDKNASDQAKKSQLGLLPTSFKDNLGNDIATGDRGVINSYPDPNSDLNANNIGTTTKSFMNSANGTNANNGTGSSTSLLPDANQIDTKMANELGKYGIIYDKQSKKVTLPDGQSFTVNDLRSGKMPNSELQSAYKQATATAQDIAAKTAGASGFGTGASGSGSARSPASDGTPSLSKIAGGLKDGSNGSTGGGVGTDPYNTEFPPPPELNKLGLKNAAEAAALLAANAKRLNSKVAGLSTNYNGEPIGVASDSIFEMVKHRYEMKNKEHSFITELLAITTN
jgi:hypothetical protein